ncbi:hypothetical protein N0V84_004988 [Fusarium piperis]|uniref:Xylanolytic transcriptional activator regulatory domain-containing protein n=1 Tax=Fusarium piperis TaxID=1435070 RepID=A0A9W8WEL8_9HYPO|nr:hypothetical protein N0V84_004988 [Fusarium piperis]
MLCLQIQTKAAVPVGVQDKSACWILYQMEEETLEAANARDGCNPDQDDAAAGPAAAATDAAVSPPNSRTNDASSTTAALTRIIPNTTSRPARAISITSSPGNSSGQGKSQSFYGATSHPHVTSPSDDSRPSCPDDLDLVNIDLDPNSPQLRDHLFQSFFRYQTLWVDIVDKENFQTHQAQSVSSRWYSTFLENAMLACATRLSTSKSVRAMGPKYCELAKAETSMAMSEPTPASLQGFLLLSEYEVTKGNNRPGWMFCGKSSVACRMLSDLGLHELASTVDTARVSKQESDLAFALLAACIIYEGVWTLYLGRPSSIPRSFMSIAASRCKAGRQSDSSWVSAWVGLCVPMAEISQVLNDQSITDSHRITLLRQLSKDVDEWHDSLPPELAYIENRLTGMDPAGYGLHTQFCKVQILVKQALLTHPNPRKRRHSQMASSEDVQTSSDESQAIIFHRQFGFANSSGA